MVQITSDTAISLTYCGTEVPETLTLNATSVVLTFQSDFAVSERGFKIEFKVQSEASTGAILYVDASHNVVICEFCENGRRTCM